LAGRQLLFIKKKGRFCLPRQSVTYKHKCIVIQAVAISLKWNPPQQEAGVGEGRLNAGFGGEGS
jgi:hypothetical protein